jgi:polyhydroxyalkanoate synthesis regulator protein
MAPKGIHNLSMLITKSRLFSRTIMPFGMRNIISTFLRTMTKVFGAYLEKFLKAFMDD